MYMVKEAFRTGKSLLSGMAVTLRELVLEEPITVSYPEVYDQVPAWFRGIPVLKTNMLTGEYKCTSCMECALACPISVISIDWHMNRDTKKKELDRFAIDMSRCMLCNYCVEACPFDSLVMGMDYELCKTNPENLVYEVEDLLRLGLKYSKSALEAHGKTCKTPTWIFHDLTHADESQIQDSEGYLGRTPIAVKVFKEKYADQLAAQEAAAAATDA